MPAFVSMYFFVCGVQSQRHVVKLNYSKLQPLVGQTVWSKAPGIQKPSTINHIINITYLAWPKASEMQKYSCQADSSKDSEVIPQDLVKGHHEDPWNMQGLGNPSLLS